MIRRTNPTIINAYTSDITFAQSLKIGSEGWIAVLLTDRLENRIGA